MIDIVEAINIGLLLIVTAVIALRWYLNQPVSEAGKECQHLWTPWDEPSKTPDIPHFVQVRCCTQCNLYQQRIVG